VLWDLDGTMIDSEPIWWEVERELFAENGGTWTQELAESLVGHNLRDSARHLIALFDRNDLDPDELVADMVVRVERHFRAGVVWQPGVLRLLTELTAAGIPMAIVTASYRSLVEALLTHLPDANFRAIVSGDDVMNGKPHPEPYLNAAAALGVDPRECLAIEDSLAGAASAQAAGCYVLAVPHVVSPPPAPRRTVVASLAGMEVHDLRRLLREASAETKTAGSRGDVGEASGRETR
jgi:HAD superfamily hydrolase (TIGR01509 family)